jgi:hypothetical protein
MSECDCDVTILNRLSYTVSDTPTHYTHWAAGQPGLLGFSEDCACMELGKGGEWHDYGCSDILFVHRRYDFACEYRK